MSYYLQYTHNVTTEQSVRHLERYNMNKLTVYSPKNQALLS